MEIYMLFLLEDEQPKGHIYFLKRKVNLKNMIIKEKAAKEKSVHKYFIKNGGFKRGSKFFCSTYG